MNMYPPSRRHQEQYPIIGLQLNMNEKEEEPGTDDVGQVCVLCSTHLVQRDRKKRHLSDSNTRGQRPTTILLLNVAGDPVNHSGKVTYNPTLLTYTSTST